MTEKDILLGELKQGFRAVSKRLDLIEHKIEKLSAAHNERKALGKILTFVLGIIGGTIGNFFTSNHN